MKVSVSVALVASLSGCGVFFGDEGIFRDRSNDYLKADSIPPLMVPEDADPEVFGQLYVVPKVDNEAFDYPETFSVPRPQPLSANVFDEKVKIQRLGERRWIAINSSPAEVWPRVRSFLSSNNLTVAVTDPQAGLIETAWLQFKDDPDNRDRYQLRIEQGVQPDSAEIHVTHTQMPRAEQPPAQVNWPDQSTDAEREAWLLDELAAALASETSSGSASLLAQTIGGEEKIRFVARGNEPVLQIDLEQNRTWATLTHAFGQEGFELLDSDSEMGIFYVDYTDPEESEGFFSGWFSSEDDAGHSLREVLDFMAVEDTTENRQLLPPAAFTARGDVPDQVPGYLFIIVGRDGSQQLLVRDSSGKPLSPRESRELLGIVRRNLI